MKTIPDQHLPEDENNSGSASGKWKQQFPLRLQKRRDKEDLRKEMFNRKKGEEELLRKFTMRKFTHKTITKLIKNLEEKVQTEEDREKVGVLFESLNARNDPATRRAKTMYLKLWGRSINPFSSARRN